MKKLCFLLFLFIFFSNRLQSQPNDTSGLMIIPSEKNPALAFVCSFMIPGLGQMYNEEVGKGLTLFFISGLGTSLFLTTEKKPKSGLYITSLVIALGSYLYSLIDAPIRAKNITNEARYKRALIQNKTSTSYLYFRNFQINPYFAPNNFGLSISLQL